MIAVVKLITTLCLIIFLLLIASLLQRIWKMTGRGQQSLHDPPLRGAAHSSQVDSLTAHQLDGMVGDLEAHSISMDSAVTYYLSG